MTLNFYRLKTVDIANDIYNLGITFIRSEGNYGFIIGLLFVSFYVGIGDRVDSVSFEYETEEEFVEEVSAIAEDNE